MILAIDAGNTRTKWMVFGRGGERLDSATWQNADLDAITAPTSWANCHRVIVSNVAGHDVARHLQNILGSGSTPHVAAIHWLRSSPAAAGVINQYERPETLGSDRWAALIGAWHETKSACLVVNAGTALTVDALASEANGTRGLFLGGSIAPGVQLMKKALLQDTHGVKQSEGSLHAFPGNTGDAVHAGVLLASAGVVQAMAIKLEQHIGQSPLIVVSGGDAELLKAAISWFNMPNQMEIVEDLVLKGLFHLERECL